MPDRIGFYVLPKGARADARGQKAGEMIFANAKDREAFVRGISMLTDASLGPLFAGGGATMTPKEAAVLLTKIQKAISSGGESTLSSVLSAEVIDLERGGLEGKLDQFCEILRGAAKGTGLLTTLPE